MRLVGRTGCLVLAAAVLTLAVVAVGVRAGTGTVTGQPSAARPSATHTVAGALPAGHVPPRSTRIARLKRAEGRLAARLRSGRTLYGDVNIRDLPSFGVESLWNKGIDGAGTSVAVIEGWNLPGIQQLLNSLDDEVGLPHATVRTVYPTGPLPRTCPTGMQRLGDYGSCSTWGRELTLDVEAVHLFAPYATIVISATPADSEIADDASSQVAPPEMMKALEYLSTRRLADVISISDGSNEGDYRHGTAEIRAQDPGELTAAARGVPSSTPPATAVRRRTSPPPPASATGRPRSVPSPRGTTRRSSPRWAA